MGFVSGFGGFCLSAAPGALSQAVTPAGPFGSVSRPPSCASRLPGLGNTYFCSIALVLGAVKGLEAVPVRPACNNYTECGCCF